MDRLRIGCRVLTKSGTRAVRDFQPAPGTPLAGPPGPFVPPSGVDPSALTFDDEGCAEPNLGSHPEDAYGATLTFLDAAESRQWEPGAALPAERMAGLEEAHRRGIPTWANMMPVVDPERALEIIRLTHDFVDLYSLSQWETLGGPSSPGEPFDWGEFAGEAADLCERLGVPCYVRAEDAAADPHVLELADSMMSTAAWTLVCAWAKPKWKTTRAARREAALDAACCEIFYG